MNQSQTSLTTSCKDCTFAIRDEMEQTGCRIQEMEEDLFFSAYDDGEEYRIYRRQCQFKRDKKWAGERSDEACLAAVHEEVKIRYNVFLETSDNEEEFLNTIRCFENQVLRPQKIIVIEQHSNSDKTYKTLLDCNLQTRWALHEFTSLPIDWRDNCIVEFPSQLYIFAKPPLHIPPLFFLDLNERINYKEKLRFGSIEGENLLIFPHGLYSMLVQPLREILPRIEKLGLRRLNYENISTEVK
jgi:hypothetical protein